VVAVSGTNQYKVEPLALVTTVAPPILAVFSALLPAAAGALEAGAALEAVPPEVAGPDEPPQAAITKAAASPADASHTLFIAYPPVPRAPGKPVT
jgi:hypothetical protein